MPNTNESANQSAIDDVQKMAEQAEAQRKLELEEKEKRSEKIRIGKRIVNIFMTVYLLFVFYTIASKVSLAASVAGVNAMPDIVRGFLTVFLFIQLSNGKQWARITLLILSGLALIYGVVVSNDSLLIGLSVAIYGGIIALFTLNNNVKAVFENN